MRPLIFKTQLQLFTNLRRLLDYIHCRNTSVFDIYHIFH